MKKVQKKFPYVVGFKWSDGSIGAYAYGTEVHNGTMRDAEAFLKYVRGVGGNKPNDYDIYKLVKVRKLKTLKKASKKA